MQATVVVDSVSSWSYAAYLGVYGVGGWCGCFLHPWRWCEALAKGVVVLVGGHFLYRAMEKGCGMENGRGYFLRLVMDEMDADAGKRGVCLWLLCEKCLGWTLPSVVETVGKMFQRLFSSPVIPISCHDSPCRCRRC